MCAAGHIADFARYLPREISNFGALGYPLSSSKISLRVPHPSACLGAYRSSVRLTGSQSAATVLEVRRERGCACWCRKKQLKAAAHKSHQERGVGGGKALRDAQRLPLAGSLGPFPSPRSEPPFSTPSREDNSSTHALFVQEAFALNAPCFWVPPELARHLEGFETRTKPGAAGAERECGRGGGAVHMATTDLKKISRARGRVGRLADGSP